MEEKFRIRPPAADDIPALWAINQASTPGVSAVSKPQLERLIALPESRCLVVAPIVHAAAAIPAPLGFLLLIAPGADYLSPNYRWFESRLARGEGLPFGYVDRVAITETARGRRLGEALYKAAYAAARAEADVIACEVNTVPPNTGSLRFHKRLGFSVVGAAAHAPSENEVVFLERSLAL